MGCQRDKLPRPNNCQLGNQQLQISAYPTMSKYRNALQQTFTFAFNKTNNDNVEPNKPDNAKPNTQATTTTCNSNKNTNIIKIYRKKLPLDKVVLVLSRIHSCCNLRFQTFCLSIQLYRKYMSSFDNPEEESIPCGYLILACIFLSMKYNEIYHPSLKQILPYIPADLLPRFNLAEYMQHEVLLFRKIGASMNFKTAKLIFDQILNNSSQEIFFYSYYMLQIGYNERTISQEFTSEQICKAIYLTMLPLDVRDKMMKQCESVQLENLIECSKRLINRRSKHTSSESSIYTKYCREKYLKVALQSYFYIKREDL